MCRAEAAAGLVKCSNLADRHRDLELTGSEEAKRVIIDAAESLVDRYNPKASDHPCIGSALNSECLAPSLLSTPIS
jgi:hypothetical protein